MTFHLLKNMFCFPLLVLKGFFSRGVNQMHDPVKSRSLTAHVSTLETPGCFHLLKNMLCFPLLVFKGIYHYWTSFFLQGSEPNASDPLKCRSTMAHGDSRVETPGGSPICGSAGTWWPATASRCATQRRGT